MRGLDPENTDPNPSVPTDSQSTDQSQSGLRAAWDKWTSRPENNAALLQFGLAMLQPRSPGQNAVGQFANAVGQGAEASQRNIETQQAQQKEEAAQAIKDRETSSKEKTAEAYAEQVRQGGAKGDANTLKGTLKTQADFRKWLAKPEDALGMTTDPIVGAISKQFPDVKTKADLLNNPAARNAAYKLFSSTVAEPGEEGSTPAPAATGQPPAPSGGPQPRIIYKGTVPYQWDGIPGHAPVPVQQQ